MALPLKELYGLNLSARKKAYVMCMFCLGILYVLSIAPYQLNANFGLQCDAREYSEAAFIDRVRLYGESQL